MEFGSKKYIVLLVLICIVFTIFIVKAFDYLPDKSVDIYNPIVNSQPSNVNQLNYNNQNQTQEINQNQSENNYDPERHKSGHIDFMPQQNRAENNNNDFEEIQAPRGVNEDIYNTSTQPKTMISSDEMAMITLFNATKIKSDGDYKKALEELQRIPELTKEREIIASSYEKIAEIYAIQKKYSTALSFAGKAYSASPNANREMLIARIYYQFGDTEKAITRFNNILYSGFKD